jgi:hypothetical protein
MRTATHPSSGSAFSRLLTSDCLHYAVAKPSLWPRTGGCKRRLFSNFGCDSPLSFSWLRCQFRSLGENLRACLFLVLRSTACCAAAFRLQRLMTMDRLPFISLGVSRVCSCAASLASIRPGCSSTAHPSLRFSYGLWLRLFALASGKYAAQHQRICWHWLDADR